jgi:hypothetical protein
MSYVAQAVEPRLWTGGGPDPFMIPERLTEELPRREDAPRLTCGMSARTAHRLYTPVVAALAVLGVFGIVTSVLTYRAGLAWRSRAETGVVRTQELAARLGDVQARAAMNLHDLSKAHEQLAAVTSQLRRSEADVAQLESRLQALGTEKAKVEDEREAVRSDRDRLAEIADLAGHVGQDVDACVKGLSNWLAGRPSPVRVAQTTSWTAWARNGDAVAAACTNAHASNERLKTAISK